MKNLRVIVSVTVAILLAFFFGYMLPSAKEVKPERQASIFCYCTERLVECALKTPPDAGVELADGGVAGPCYNGHFVECEDANACECDCAPAPKPTYEEDDAGL